MISNSEVAFYTAQLAEIDRDVERGQLPSDEAGAARAEAGRRLLAAKAAAATSTLEGNNGMRRRLAAIGGFLVIAGVGAGAYAQAGRPNMPDAPLASRQQTAPQDPIAVAVARIEADAAASPDSVKAWSTLAPAYLHLGRYADSVRAYRKVLQLTGEDPSLRASLGEAETAAAGGKVTAQAKADFETAFAGDPKLGLAQYYLGLAAEQAGDDKKAIATYEAVLGKVQDHPQWVAIINEKLATLKHETTAAPTREADAGAAANSGKNPPDMIQGMVSRLAARIDKNGGTADEWLRLIRSYAVLGERDKAKAALASARKAHGADAKAAADFDAIEKELHLDGSAAVSVAEAPAKPAEPATPAGAATSAAPADAAKNPPDMIQGMVSRLAARIDKNGGTADEWLRLIRSYAVLGEPDKAKAALASARKAHGADAKAAADFDAIEKEFHLDGFHPGLGRRSAGETRRTGDAGWSGGFSRARRRGAKPDGSDSGHGFAPRDPDCTEGRQRRGMVGVDPLLFRAEGMGQGEGRSGFRAQGARRRRHRRRQSRRDHAGIPPRHVGARRGQRSVGHAGRIGQGRAPGRGSGRPA